MAYLDENGLAYFKGKLDQITDRLNDQITETDTALDNLTDLIERDTASGSIVEANAEYAAPVDKLVVNIEPQQDLHGYDNPWPAGGGKNKCAVTVIENIAWATENTDLLTSINSLPNGIYTMSFKSTLKTLDSQEYVSVDWFSGFIFTNAAGNFSCQVVTSTSHPVGTTVTYAKNLEITDSNRGAFTHAYVYGAGNNSDGKIGTATLSEVQIEAGDVQTTFTPYSNICPISGHTGASVYDDPKHGGTIKWNQLRLDTEQTADDYEGITTAQDLITHKYCIENLSRSTNYSSGSTRKVVASAAPVSNHTYAVLSDVTDPGIGVIIFAGPTRVAIGLLNSIFTVPERTDYTSFCLRLTRDYDFANAHPVGDKFYFTLNLIDLTEMFGEGNEPSTIEEVKSLFPHEWYPYNAGEESCVSAVNGDPYRQLSVTFPSSAGTVYGGTLTVNPDRTGTLVVDRAMVDMGTLTWIYDTTTLSGTPVFKTEVVGRALGSKNFISSQYKNTGASRQSLAGTNGCIATWNETSSRTVGVTDLRYSDAAIFKAAVNGVQLAYEITTPTTYTLTATEISGILSTIRGTNYIWANTGDIAELKYQSGGFATTNTAAQMVEKSAGTKADVITETASGTIVSFSDGADGLPVKSLTVNIEPQQDLHGYDNPWPAGGGKNLYQAKDGSYSYSAGITKNVVNGAIGLTGTANSEFNYHPLTGSIVEATQLTLPAGTYTASISGLTSGMKYIMGGSGSEVPYHEIQTDGSYTFTLSAEGGLGYDVLRIASGTSVNTTLKIQVEAGSTATPWASNSNICPISGFTGAEVTRTGKNLLDVSNAVNATNVVNGVDPDGTIHFKDVTAQWGTSYIGEMFIKKGQRYAVSASLSYGRIGFSSTDTYPRNGVNIPALTVHGSGSIPSIVTKDIRTNSFTANFTGNIYAFFCSDMSQGSHVEFSTTILVELGSTADDFEPYTGSQLSVTFPSSAGTVYGGTLTINPDRTGTLVVDRAMVDLGTLSWFYNSAQLFYYVDIANMKPKYNNESQITDIYSSILKYKGVGGSWNSMPNASYGINSTQLRVHLEGYESSAAFAAAVSGQTIVYPLASPKTYQLTSSEISAILTTLYGTNNIWADAGDITVEYPVDTKLYIQQLTKPTEDDMTADNAISAGTFFMIGNTLYLATSQIAAGAAITPGTNATKLSLADALNQLNA